MARKKKNIEDELSELIASINLEEAIKVNDAIPSVDPFLTTDEKDELVQCLREKELFCKLFPPSDNEIDIKRFSEIFLQENVFSARKLVVELQRAIMRRSADPLKADSANNLILIILYLRMSIFDKEELRMFCRTFKKGNKTFCKFPAFLSENDAKGYVNYLDSQKFKVNYKAVTTYLYNALVKSGKVGYMNKNIIKNDKF